MFATIRRHQGWLLATFAVIVIISLVVYGPGGCTRTTGNTRSRGGSEFGSLGGQPITLDQMNNAVRAVILEYFVKQGQWADYDIPDVKRNVDYQAYLYLFIDQKLKDLNIVVDAAGAATFIRNAFGAINLTELEARSLRPHGMSIDDFDRYIRHEVGKQQLVMIAGLNGYLVTPQEAETEYRADHQEIASSIILFSSTNFLASVPSSPDAIAQFYTNRLADYRVPERAQIDYVKFNVTNYFSAAEKAMTNLDALADNDVKENGTNLFPGSKTPEESRAAYRMRHLKEHALVDARRDAYAFATELSDLKPVTAENLRTLATKKGLTVLSPAPFDRENGPQDMTTPMQFVKAAFGRTPEDPFAPPITTEDGSYVLGLKVLIPSSIPPLKSIEAKVTADYRHLQALILAEQASMKLYTTYLTNALPQGKSFAAVCAEANVKPEPLTPFSRSSRTVPEKVEGRVDLKTLQDVVFDTQVGQPSQPARARDGAFILFVEKQLPVDEAKLKTDFPEYLARVRQYRLSDAFNAWLTVQIRRDPAFAELMGQKQQELQMKSARPTKS